MSRLYGQWEFLHPDELEEILKDSPYAYVPLGTYEHHGFHLPVCFDGIKAHTLCLRTAQKTGGVVLPTFFYGTGGGHIGYKWTIIVPDAPIRELISVTLDHLARFGFKTVVLLTGHYPTEQVVMAKELADAAALRNPGTRYIGLTEPEITTPLPGDAYAGDHAATYETSLAMALDPAWTRLDYLTPHDPAQVKLPGTPANELSMFNPADPLYAIYGRDPRTTASAELGKKLVEEIIERLSSKVNGDEG